VDSTRCVRENSRAAWKHKIKLCSAGGRFCNHSTEFLVCVGNKINRAVMVMRTLMNVTIRVSMPLSSSVNAVFFLILVYLGYSFNFAFILTSVSSLFLVVSCCLPVTVDSTCSVRENNRAERSARRQAGKTAHHWAGRWFTHTLLQTNTIHGAVFTHASRLWETARPKRSQQCDVDPRHVAKL